MAVWTRPCVEFPCLRQTAKYSGTSRNGVIKSTCSFLKTHVCTVALSLTLFNTVRLPREAYRYGAIPYLVVYTLWLLFVGLATSLLQLATGQLSQQDAVGVWRAVPILRGVGHIQLITSYLLCVYNMLYVALAAAFLMWIGKDTFPLRVCTRLQMTPNGYENKVNATECFHTTFLSPFAQHPEYIGIMAVLLFLSWFFLPIFLYGLAKSYKITMSLLAPITVVIAIVLSSFLSHRGPLEAMLSSAHDWTALTEPYIWFSGLVQAMMSAQIGSGNLISCGGTVYKQADVRWVTATLVTYNLVAGWLCVLLWQSIGEGDQHDLSFISVLSQIYQSSASLGNLKVWPLLAYLVVLLSGIITILSLLYPIYDRLLRIAGDKWKLIASVGSVLGTCLTMALLINAVELVRVLDELIVPVLLVFATTLEVVAFVFIYGCDMLRIDIEFLTATKSSPLWIVFWWTTPVFLIGVTGWWLKCILKDTVGEMGTLWPLAATFVGILIIMMVLAAVAVAKEEQFNLLSKIASAFRPSRLWGPEDPNSRYNWMVRRYTTENLSNEDVQSVDSYINYPKTMNNNTSVEKKVWTQPDQLYHPEELYHRAYSIYTNTIPEFNDNINGTYVIPKKNRPLKPDRKYVAPPNVHVVTLTNPEPKFISPNVCVANENLDCLTECYCNRHFTLNVPTLKRNELSTSL